MKSAEKASKILRSAESDLRKLIADAANEGDYESVEHIAAWASDLRTLYESHIQEPPRDSRRVNGAKGKTKPAKKATKRPAKKRKGRVG